MIRTLRILAAISFISTVGYVWLIATGVIQEPLVLPLANRILVGSLIGELVFAVGILALAATANRRQVAWFALFALLLLLLHVLPLVNFIGTTDMLVLFEVPPRMVAGTRVAWALLLPALIPGAAVVYTLIVQDRRPIASAAPPLAVGAARHGAD